MRKQLSAASFHQAETQVHIDLEGLKPILEGNKLVLTFGTHQGPVIDREFSDHILSQYGEQAGSRILDELCDQARRLEVLQILKDRI